MNTLQPGLAVRTLAVEALAAIFERAVSFDDFVDAHDGVKALQPRDRAFLMILVLTALRHKGEIDTVVSGFLAKPLPRKSGTAAWILLTGAAQLLFLDAAPHAVIDLAVRLAKQDHDATHFSGLINAVLRKIAVEGKAKLAGAGGSGFNTPQWLWSRWADAYGIDIAHAIARANALEPPLDISVKDNPDLWAQRLDGEVLPTGTVRIANPKGAVDALPGFDEGSWWVQDAAAAIPAKLFGDAAGKSALDLCAAPGGKTLQLAVAGASVTAVDSSAARLERLRDNLKRTSLEATIITGDMLAIDTTDRFDCVLLDAPCSATGTLRRHPDLPFLKTSAQIDGLATLQRKLLRKAASLVKPGGCLVYCTCSLEPNEGENQITAFPKAHEDFTVKPVVPGEAGIESHFVTAAGYFRSLPFMTVGKSSGLDGFFAARLTRSF